jgi:hypothetical protein
MDNDLTPDERQRRLADAAASFTVPVAQSYATLLPLKDSIATLRRKGASFRAIVDILRAIEVKVSQDTLSRFCREVIEQRPERKSKRRRPLLLDHAGPAHTPPAAPPSGPAPADTPAPSRPPKDDGSVPPQRGRGPRVADPSSI